MAECKQIKAAMQSARKTLELSSEPIDDQQQKELAKSLEALIATVEQKISAGHAETKSMINNLRAESLDRLRQVNTVLCLIFRPQFRRG